MNRSDLSKATQWALYLPAISSFYVKTINSCTTPGYIGDDRLPSTFDRGVDGMNFLSEDSYFYYPYGLYSAGHAEWNLEKAANSEKMIHSRDQQKTILIGDSSGFQISTGVIKVDWSKFKDKEGDKLRADVLNWLENTSDWSMTLDVPPFAAAPPLNKKTGLKSFEDTLDFSVFNLHYFMEHRTPGKTKFLNVISGNTVENARLWYEGVKGFSDPDKVEEMGYSRDRTLEGYAFAGIHAKNMFVTLERILNLRDDGLLEGKDWIHCLGLGRLDWACFLTAIQREVRKHYNPNIQISFDAASPFVATAYGLMYYYNHFTNKRFIYSMSPGPDEKNLGGSKLPAPCLSPISSRLDLGDICVLSKEHAIIDGEHRYDVTREEVEELKAAGVDAQWEEAKTNKLGKVPKTSWDVLSYLFIMSHNVYKHIEAVQEANRIADLEYHRLQPNWRNWIKDRKSATANEISEFVPHTVLYFRSFVEELFDPNTQDPYQMLEDFKPFLDAISFGGMTSSHFENLFEVQESEVSVDKFVDMNDDKIVELEHIYDEVEND